ncbi:MAG: HisA/HisF-related TIM barrel protein [Patescibacteria group bacterium]
MVTLNSLTLENPIVASSGALAFGRGYRWDWPLVRCGVIRPSRIGAVVTKTLTADSWAGNWRGWNQWQVLRPLRGGWVNAFGLTNRGLRWFVEREYLHVYYRNLIVSITDPNPQRIPEMVALLNQVDILAVEVNLSCPNTPQWVDLQRRWMLTRDVLVKSRQVTRHPLVVKIGYLTEAERDGVASACWSADVDAIAMINSVPFRNLFPGRQSPLKFGGGVSGELIRKLALEQVQWFAEQRNFPVIGGGGVSTQAHVKQFLAAGAQAVSVGSAHILRPWISTHLASQCTRAQ